jgi:hypothetical protein
MVSDLGNLPFVFIFFVCAELVMGFLGLDLLIQAFRGAPLKSGFSYKIFKRLPLLRPAMFSVGIPVLLGLTVAGSAATQEAGGLPGAGALAMIWVAFIVNVSAHELSHFVAARLVGLTPNRIVIGPLDLVRTDRGWRPRLCKEWFSLFGGLVAVPATPWPTARQMIVYAAGGPVGTLGVLLLFLALNPYHEVDLTEANFPGLSLISVGVFGAIVTLVINLFPSPMTPAGIPTDGYVIRQNIARLRSPDGEAA